MLGQCDHKGEWEESSVGAHFSLSYGVCTHRRHLPVPGRVHGAVGDEPSAL